MIHLENSPNFTGVAIYGDNLDFEKLYDAFHEVVGQEGEFPSFAAARIRILGISYDLRHALMGHREIEFVDNGLDESKKKSLGMLAPEKNVYLKIYVYWPELLFVQMALNDFIQLYGRKRAKKTYVYIMDKKNIWDENIAMVRLFQGAVANCIKETVSESSFTRMMNLMHKEYTWFNNYVTQYLDLLNVRYIEMDREKRIKSIPTMAKRLAEYGTEYKKIKEDIELAAEQHNTTVENIRLINIDYPEEIEW